MSRTVTAASMLSEDRLALVTVWNREGEVVLRRAQELDEPLSTLWDR